MTIALILTLPWIAVAAFAAFAIRMPRPLAARGRARVRPDPPLVSVIVPARNESDTIGACVESLVASGYPAFEVIVVNDRSDDDTGALARGVERGNARRLLVVDGEPLADGWLGKPWACRQGVARARGDLLLFTDADTVHGPDLLERAVDALGRDGVDAVSVVGRQILGTPWEKLVQPQVFALLAFRFPDLRRPVEPGGCHRAIASGQFILIRRGAYDAVGGHEAVRGEVVEDLRLAQRLCRSGRRLSVREAEDALATRMYRSLGHMVEGWSKNLALGTAQTLPPRIRRIAPPVMLALGTGLWLVPPAALGASLAGVGGPGLRLWSGLVVGLSAVFWMAGARQMRINPLWGALYPVGSAVGAFIFLRSWLRGRTVEWKGRTYRVDPSVLEDG